MPFVFFGTVFVTEATDNLFSTNHNIALMDKQTLRDLLKTASSLLDKNGLSEGTFTDRKGTQYHYYTGVITPKDDTIFVFGSNPEGRHGRGEKAGSSGVAVREFGAIKGVGEGLQGRSYAIPTKDLRVRRNNGYKSISPEQITESIRKMYEVACQMPDKKFKVAYHNGADKITRCGYTGLELVNMFLVHPVPDNVYFSHAWRRIIEGL